MKQKKFLILLAIAAFAFFTTQRANASLIQNGDFGTGDFTDWSVTTASSGSNVGVGTSFGYSPYPITPPGGSTYEVGFHGSGPSNDAISQNFATLPGQWYTFSFDLTGGTPPPPYGVDNNFQALWNGSTVFQINDQISTLYEPYSFTVQATGSSTTIAFEAFNAPTYYDLANVDVSFSAAPEPGTLFLFGSVLLGFGGFQLRKKSSAV
jgi:hypothetical protein